jgi:DNA (cytosine-5)-methyltransferase 1
MRYLSVCSGIEAATVAWHPLGWTPIAFAEIDRFPSAVLAHHYPHVPNWGDLVGFHAWPDTAVDLLVGGTPCQSFSVAGLRAGLDHPGGSLVLVYLALAHRVRPRWLVWENVPGVLSIDDGRAFGALLGGLAALGFGFAYRVLDAQYFGVPQRRRRVFVVGHSRNWRRAAAVLFERASLCGDPAPRRHAGTDITGDPSGIAGSCSSKWSKGTGGPAGDEHYNLISEADDGEPMLAFADVADPIAANQDRTYTREGRNNFRLSNVAHSPTAVRRLTPRECERLQGFPDDYTLIRYRGRLAPDRPRYRALGNSMAVPVMRWIGERIARVEAIAP